MMRLNQKNVQWSTAFSVGILVSVSCYWVFTFLSRGRFINSYFISDHTNTAMDYFNMLANMDYSDPYSNNANYPAFCFLLLKFMHLILWQQPTELGNGYSIRENMNAQLSYFLFTGICVLIIWEVIHYIAKGEHWEKTLFSSALLFSGPMFFEFERGNLLLIALTMSLVFFAWYDSNKKYLRMLAYVSLSIAAAIKIYPAVFGLLLIWKRRYKEAVILILMGITTFIVPFFFFGGLSSLKAMVRGYSASQIFQEVYGLGCNYSFDNLVKLIAASFGKKISTVSIGLIYLSGIICVFLFTLSRKEWQRIYSLVLLMIWIPQFSYSYTLTFLFLPILSLFFRNDEKQMWLPGYTILFGLLLIPYALPMIDKVNAVINTDYVWPLLVSWGTVITNASLIAIAIMILFENIICIFRNSKDVSAEH